MNSKKKFIEGRIEIKISLNISKFFLIGVLKIPNNLDKLDELLRNRLNF